MNNYTKNFLILVLSLFWLVPGTLFAAEIFFRSDQNVFPAKESFLVEVFMDTESARINAVEGTILFPDELLELKEIREGNSALNFWVDKPESAEPGKISFSGMTPGGFSGADRLLLGIIFETKDLGESSLRFGGTVALLNDGLGTKTDIEETNFDFAVSASAGAADRDLALLDTEPPESFTIFVASEPSLFEGKYFAVWSTVDKGAGMDHYEVREGFWADFETAESPYALKDQSLRKSIYVKAVYKSQNERVVKMKAQNGGLGLAAWTVLVIIILVVILMLRKKIWPKRPE